MPKRPFSRWSGIVGGLALARVMVKHHGVPEAIAQALGDRLREALPSSKYRVEVEGPVLDIKWPHGSSSSLLGLALVERGTPDEKLRRVFDMAGADLQDMIYAVNRDRFPESDFEPHVDITEKAVLMWWGAALAENAPVRFRPILRSELGL